MHFQLDLEHSCLHDAFMLFARGKFERDRKPTSNSQHAFTSA